MSRVRRVWLILACVSITLCSLAALRFHMHSTLMQNKHLQFGGTREQAWEYGSTYLESVTPLLTNDARFAGISIEGTLEDGLPRAWVSGRLFGDRSAYEDLLRRIRFQGMTNAPMYAMESTNSNGFFMIKRGESPTEKKWVFVVNEVYLVEDMPPSAPTPTGEATETVVACGDARISMIRLPSAAGKNAQEVQIGKYEVTIGEWEAIMGGKPEALNGETNSALPVTYVSLVACGKFIAELNRKNDRWLFRLPERKEWEYACRAGNTAKYCFGNDANLLHLYAWYRDNAGLEANPVGRRRGNAWGIHDMHGNVGEWCNDGSICGGDYTSRVDELACGRTRCLKDFQMDGRTGLRLLATPRAK